MADVIVTTASITPLLQCMLHDMMMRDLARNLVPARRPHSVREVLGVEEAARLLEAPPGIKYKGARGVAYGAGLRVTYHTSLSRTETRHLTSPQIEFASTRGFVTSQASADLRIGWHNLPDALGAPLDSDCVNARHGNRSANRSGSNPWNRTNIN